MQGEEGTTSTKFLLLVDQLSVDQKRHLSIKDIGIILDRLSSKILDVERLERERIGGGFPLVSRFYPELRHASLWCMTELVSREAIDRAYAEARAKAEAEARAMAAEASTAAWPCSSGGRSRGQAGSRAGTGVGGSDEQARFPHA